MTDPQREPLPTSPRPSPSSGRPCRIVYADEIDQEDVDQDALRVLSRLQRNGYEAYLVGGCVRDLLLGRKPKDFDVATAAHPRQIKRLFRNGRIIGRRFRLVHVVYRDNVIETSTFRRQPEEPHGDDDDLLITEDNEYGTAEEDALRRDFTVNGLFLDPSSWEILDYVGGLADLEAGVLRTIGEPSIRMAEDPVRILRAIKFATRLGFRIEDATWEAMCAGAGDLVRSAPPRVFEELMRLMRSGTSLGAFRMMRASGALKALLPRIDRHLGARNDPDPEVHERADAYWRLLGALDSDVHAGHEPTVAVLLAVLYLRVLEAELGRQGYEPNVAAAEAPVVMDLAGELFDPLAGPARVPRRAVERTRRILAHQRRFHLPSSKTRSTISFLESTDFQEALHLFGIRCAAWGQGWDVYEGWVDRHARHLELPAEQREELRASLRKRGRRRRRGGRRRRRT